MSPDSTNLAAFEQFSRENLREVVQQRLETEMEQEQTILEERMRSRMFEITRMVQEEIFNRWRDSLGRTRENSGIPEGPSTGSMPSMPGGQSSLDGDIANILVPQPSTDHVDARASMTEKPDGNQQVHDSTYGSQDSRSSGSNETGNNSERRASHDNAFSDPAESQPSDAVARLSPTATEAVEMDPAPQSATTDLLATTDWFSEAVCGPDPTVEAGAQPMNQNTLDGFGIDAFDASLFQYTHDTHFFQYYQDAQVYQDSQQDFYAAAGTDDRCVLGSHPRLGHRWPDVFHFSFSSSSASVVSVSFADYIMFTGILGVHKDSKYMLVINT